MDFYNMGQLTQVITLGEIGGYLNQNVHTWREDIFRYMFSRHMIAYIAIH